MGRGELFDNQASTTHIEPELVSRVFGYGAARSAFMTFGHRVSEPIAKTCARVRRDFSPYLDGELSPEREQALQRHVAECSACAAHLEELRTLTRGLRRLPRPAVPPDLARQILGALERESRKAPTWFELFRALGRLAFIHPKAAAMAISVLLTTALLGALLSVLRPVPEVPLAYYSAPIALNAQQYGLLNGGAELPTGSYTFPRLRSSGHLERLFRAASSDQLVVVTFVHPDGRASLVDIVAPSRLVDPAEVQTSFSNVRFEPAKRAGQQPVSTQLVVLLHRLDVTY